MIGSDALNRQIIDLWNSGMPASEMARECGMTRNAIIGRIARMRAKGIPLRSLPKATEKLKRAIKREVRTPYGWIKKKQFKPNNDNIVFEQLSLGIQTPEQNLDIMQLFPGACRFIVGSDRKRGALYCGGTKHSKSYCKKHSDVCYAPVRHNS